jgi:CRP/FNR family cyclic AMP-dependent transcriptional regulator
VRLPQEYLARMMGVSRQTVNKALRVLARDQVLALHYAEIEILDMAALVGRAGRLSPGLASVLGSPPSLTAGPPGVAEGGE